MKLLPSKFMSKRSICGSRISYLRVSTVLEDEFVFDVDDKTKQLNIQPFEETRRGSKIEIDDRTYQSNGESARVG